MTVISTASYASGSAPARGLSPSSPSRIRNEQHRLALAKALDTTLDQLVETPAAGSSVVGDDEHARLGLIGERNVWHNDDKRDSASQENIADTDRQCRTNESMRYDSTR